jgi:hypothetical protein
LNNGTKIGLVVVLLMVLFGALSYMQDKGYNWYSEMNDSNFEQPYGLKFMDEYLRKQYDEGSFQFLDSSITVDLPKYLENDTVYDYLFIGHNMYLDTAELEALLDFVEDGNNAIFLSKKFPYDLMEELNTGECVYDWYENDNFLDSTIYANFEEQDLKTFDPVQYSRLIKDKKVEYAWHFIDEDYFCIEEKNFTALGRFNQNQVNFFRAEYGQGQFYFHSNPEFFTNYYLTQKENQEYAQKVLSYATGSHLLWDKQYNLRNFDHNISQNDGPLKYILSQESLKWALYCLVGALLLYLMFEAKRKQRSIPIIVGKENTSIEYVETISELYFQRKGHSKIYDYITIQFNDFIRKRYRLSIKKKDENFIKLLSVKSHIKKERIEALLKHQNNGKFEGNIDEKFLISYHEEIQYFYNHCK